MCQSPLEDDELRGLASTDTEAVSTPEPESEIEIAAEAATAKKDDKNDDNDGDGDQAAGTELLNSAAARLKLSTRPGEDNE